MTDSREKHRFRLMLVVFLVSLSAMAQGQSSRVEDIAARAFAAVKSGNYTQAIELYMSAYELGRSSAILYNLATIYDRWTRDPAMAKEYYQRYLAASDAEPELARKATLRLEQIQSAAENLPAKAVEKPSSKPSAPEAAAKNLTRSAVDEKSVLTEAVPPTESGNQLVRTSEGGLTGLQTTGIVVGGVGLVAVGVGLVFSSRAASTYAESNQYCQGKTCGDQRGIELTNSAIASARVATILVTVGGLAAAGGLGFLVFGGRGNAAKVALAPVVAPAQVGLVARGEW
jgi:tetratricopeptide (TPR) repeat protein